MIPKNLKNFVSILLVLTFLFSPTMTIASSDDDTIGELIPAQITLKKLNAIENLIDKEEGDWKIFWDDVTNNPRAAINIKKFPVKLDKISKKDFEEKIKKKSNRFINENNYLLNINNATDIQIEKIDVVKNEGLIRYQQYYEMLPVYKGKLKVTIASDGSILGFGSSIYDNIDIATEPKISKEEAIEIVKEKFGFNFWLV